MPKSALIITVGTRDVQIDKEKLIEILGEEKASFCYNAKGYFLARKGGEILLNAYSDLKGELKFPIIYPALDNFKGNTDIEEIFLVCTDQDYELVGSFAESDSLFFGEILAKNIPQKMKYTPKIRIIKIEEEVVYLDSKYKEFKEKFETGPFKHISTKFEKVLILNQGGIDAINYGLMLAALNKLGNKVEVLNVNEKTQKANSLEFTGQYLKDKEYETAISHIKHFEYAAIEVLDLPHNFKAFAKYATSRLHFDFDACEKYLNQITIKKDYRDMLLVEVRDIREKPELLLKELAINALIQFQKGAYVDFLLRFFRLIEENTKRVAFSLLGDTFSFDGNNWRAAMQSYLLRNPELKAFFESTACRDYFKFNKFDYLPEKHPNIPILEAIILFYAPNHTVIQLNAKTLGLRNMRNKSIGAHDFQPVSLTLMNSKLSEQNINTQQVVDMLLGMMGIEINPFENINEVMIRLLK